MRKLLKAAVAGLLVLSMVSATGCSSQQTEQKKWKIAVLTKSSSSYWEPVKTAGQHANEELNVEVTVYQPEKTDLELQKQLLQNIISTDIDALVMAAVDPEEENELLASANAKGIQIITYDSDVNYAGKISYVGTQNVTAGATAAGAAAQLLNYEGKIGIIYHEEAGTALLRRDGFIDELKGAEDVQTLPQGAGSKPNNAVPELDEEGNPIETEPETEPVPENTSRYAGIQVVDSLLGESDVEISKQEAKELILNDHVDLIYATNQKGGQGACEAVAELIADGSVQPGQVKVICFDYFRADGGDATYYIENDILAAVFLQNPYNMAYIGIKYARDLLEGEEVERSLDTGATMLTKANINEPAIQFLISQSY